MFAARRRRAASTTSTSGSAASPRSQAVFGGLLGSTFNFVFEKQLETCRTATASTTCSAPTASTCGSQLEGNSLAELIRRNTDLGGTMDVIFKTADFNFDVARFHRHRARRRSATASSLH